MKKSLLVAAASAVIAFAANVAFAAEDFKTKDGHMIHVDDNGMVTDNGKPAVDGTYTSEDSKLSVVVKDGKKVVEAAPTK